MLVYGLYLLVSICWHIALCVTGLLANYRLPVCCCCSPRDDVIDVEIIVPRCICPQQMIWRMIYIVSSRPLWSVELRRVPRSAEIENDANDGKKQQRTIVFPVNPLPNKKTTRN